MVNIPSVTRQRLASSVVGTPGVDTSGRSIANSVATAAASGAELLNQSVQRRQKAMDNVETASLYSEAIVASQRVLSQHQKDYANDPTGKSQILEQNLDGVYDSIKQKATNPRVKQDLEVQMAQARGSSLIKENVWSFDQENLNTKNRIITSSNGLAVQANVVGMSSDILDVKLMKLSELSSTAQDNMDTAQAAGFDLGEFRTKGLQSIHSGFISGLIESDPAAAYRILDNPTSFYSFDKNGVPVEDLLGIKERADFKEAARKKFEGAVAAADFQVKLDAAMMHGDTYDKIIDNTATLADINALEYQGITPEEKANVQALRDIYLERKPFDVKTDSAAYLQFVLKYDKIKKDLAKDKRITDPLQDIIGFDREITQAVSQKFITAEEGKNLRDMMIAPVYEKARTAKRGGFLGLGFGQTPWEAGYAAINKQLDNDKSLTGAARDQRKYEVLSAFVEKFNELPNQTEEGATMLAQQLITSNAKRNNPILGTLPEMPNSIMTVNGQTTNILSGASKLAPEAGIKPAFTEQISNLGRKRRVYADGRVEIIEAK